MVFDRSQQVTAATPTAGKPSAATGPRQAVAGLMPPQLDEALIREAWPSVLDRSAGLATLASKLIKSVILAPLGWLLLAPLFARKLMPVLCKRYPLTNRRLMIRRGLKPHPVQEVALADIDEVRLAPNSSNGFYRSGTLEVVSKGHVVMTLLGVPEPEGFRHAIINAYKAWVPEKATGPFLPASAPVEG